MNYPTAASCGDILVILYYMYFFNFCQQKGALVAPRTSAFGGLRGKTTYAVRSLIRYCSKQKNTRYL